MDTETIQSITERFQRYVNRFRKPDGTFSSLVQIKIDHSRRVADDCAGIAAELGWSRGRICLARAVGLLHDIGRFRQVTEHGTFWDSRSVSHAELGFKILARSRILDRCRGRERLAILSAVRHHSRPHLPPYLAADTLPLLNLLRDADKLDILLVAVETMSVTDVRAHPDLVFGISREGPPSAEVMEDVLKNRSAPYEKVKSLADLTAVRLAWVYHVTHVATLRRIAERRLLERLMKETPHRSQLKPIFEQARAFVRAQVNRGG
ncbi:MAG: HD domain-containing protein [Kiritimatiellae bacterium]|nr:HD domain-containing protein [Kiritimatiellia bacterium]